MLLLVWGRVDNGMIRIRQPDMGTEPSSPRHAHQSPIY
jgi:hypothetical protein